MVMKLLLYIFVGSGLFIPLGLAAWVYVLKPRLGPVLERRRLYKKAAQRRRLIDTSSFHICIVCEQPTNPRYDIYDEKTQSWSHPTCYCRLTGIEPPKHLEERKPS